MLDDKNTIDILRELEDKVFSDLKVASLGVIKKINDASYTVDLIPRPNKEIVTITTLNKLSSDPVEGDIIVVLFLDNITRNFDANSQIYDKLTKHSYASGVAIQKIKGNTNSGESSTKDLEKEIKAIKEDIESLKNKVADINNLTKQVSDLSEKKVDKSAINKIVEDLILNNPNIKGDTGPKGEKGDTGEPGPILPKFNVIKDESWIQLTQTPFFMNLWKDGIGVGKTGDSQHVFNYPKLKKLDGMISDYDTNKNLINEFRDRGIRSKTSGDCDTLKEIGVYSGSFLNNPPNSSVYGTLIVMPTRGSGARTNINYLWQLYVEEKSNSQAKMWFRSTTSGNFDSSPWRSIKPEIELNGTTLEITI